MPLIEAKPDALAMIYAKTLLQMVEQKGGRDAVMGILGELEDILEIARENPRFGEFLASRVVSETKRATSLLKVLGGRVSDITLRFLQVVNRKGRLGHLPAIVAAFDLCAQEKFGRVEVDVYTAEPIDASGSKKIQDGLALALKKEVVIHPYIDHAMIGGVKIRVGDQFIDASVATQLRKMSDTLRNEGQSKLKAKFDKIIEG
jgi:F-type H+-transporting ATPase subunit delta